MNCSALPIFLSLVLWLLLTSCRSLLLRISPSTRPHGINQYSFLVYLLGLRNRVTVTFWTSLPHANLSAYYAFVPSFCPSGYDFAIPSSRLHLTMQTLGVTFGLVGNYLPADFHRRALICPSYMSNAQRFLTVGRFVIFMFPVSDAIRPKRRRRSGDLPHLETLYLGYSDRNLRFHPQMRIPSVYIPQTAPPFLGRFL